MLKSVRNYVVSNAMNYRFFSASCPPMKKMLVALRFLLICPLLCDNYIWWIVRIVTGDKRASDTSRREDYFREHLHWDERVHKHVSLILMQPFLQDIVMKTRWSWNHTALRVKPYVKLKLDWLCGSNPHGSAEFDQQLVFSCRLVY